MDPTGGFPSNRPPPDHLGLEETLTVVATKLFVYIYIYIYVAEDVGGGGDKLNYKTCRAPNALTPLINKPHIWHRPGCRPVIKRTVCGYLHQWADERFGYPPSQGRSRSLKWSEIGMADCQEDHLVV